MHHDHSADWRQHLIPFTPKPEADDGQHPVAEFFFDPLGIRLVQKGWSVFPQNRDERRGPGLVDHRALKWKEFSTRLPTIEEVRWWAAFCPMHNVAAIMGSASGETLALDIDVSDETISLEIQRLANKYLGDTPYRRVGCAPRIVLLYRQAPEAEQAANERIPSRSFRFLRHDADGLPIRSDDGLEILSRGKPVTFYGNHHKTGQYFKWIGKHPAWNSSELAPLITMEQVVAFLAAVQELRPFHRNTSATSSEGTWTYDAAAGLHIPRKLTGNEWVEGEDGIVVDGREQFLFRLAGIIVRSNPGPAHAGDAGIEQLRALVAEQFKARAEMSGKWTEDFLRSQIADKVSRAIRDADDNNTWRNPVAVDHETNTSHFPTEASTAVDAEKAPDLDWVKPAVERAVLRLSKGKGPKMVTIDATSESKAQAAMMPREERKAEGQRAADELKGHLHEALEFAHRVADIGWTPPMANPDARMPLFGIKGPTGLGKTVSLVKLHAKLTKERRERDPNAKRVNLVVAVPAHANAAEVAGVAMTEGAVDVMDETVAAAEAAGLRVLHYKGRITAGCVQGDKLDLLYAAGVSGSRMCHSVDYDKLTGEKDERWCWNYDNCAYRKQLKALADGDIDMTVVPHNAMNMPLPKELKEGVQAVAVDEAIFKTLVGHMVFPLSALREARAEPKLTKEERNSGLNPYELLAERNQAVDLVLDAFDRKEDPARALLSLSRKLPSKPGEKAQWKHPGLALIESAKRCVAASANRAVKVNPDMTLDDVMAAIDTPTSKHADGEGVFWKVVGERLQDLIADMEARNEALRTKTTFDERTRRARGETDERIQLLVDRSGKKPVKNIRVSYFKRLNFGDLPTVLIDASLSKRITEKLWPHREVIVREVQAPVHVRTILVADAVGTDSAFIPALAKTDKGLADNAARAELWRHGATVFGGRCANSGVLYTSSLAVREFVETEWAAPPNSDFLHQGNSRGYDFAKVHAALYSYGRLEFPPEVIDAYKAVFTYNDPEPERPWNINGDGTGPDGKSPLKAPEGERTILMRDGTKRVYKDAMYPEGSWAREMQIQFTDEELRQTVGRLRPVHRVDSDAVWINCSKVVPEGFVVDEIVSLLDLVRPNHKTDHIFEAARRSHGILSHRGMAFLHRDLVLDGTPLTERELQGVVDVSWEVVGFEGRRVERQVLNYVDDIEAAVEAFVAESGHEVVEGSIKVGPRPARALINHKAPDKQDRARSAIPKDEQDRIEAAGGPMALRAALMEERAEREAARRASSLHGVRRDLGREPDDMNALPAGKGREGWDIPRSQAKLNLTARMLKDFSMEQSVSTDSSEAETTEAA